MSDVERRSSLKRSIGRLESSIGRRYEGAETHYDRVAVDLIALYEDPLLAEAGFLHGIPSRVLPQIAPDPLPGVAEVLASWSVLRGSLQGGVKSPSPSAPPPMAMLDGLREPRAAPLLAIDCLDRWDPRGAMREWTRQFCRRAAPPPAREPFDPLDGPASAMGATDAHERWREDQALGYLRTVAAPVAEFCGLWLERSASLNLAFRGERPEVFDQIVRWCIARQAEQCLHAVDAIDKILPLDRVRGEGCSWSWRHCASIGEKLPLDRPEAKWHDELWRCGYVTIDCVDAPRAYELLGCLHLTHGVQIDPRWFRDTIGAPTLGGYQALHTVVTVATPHGRLQATVRFVPRASSAREEAPWRALLLGRLEERRRIQREQRREGFIRVFTPLGAYRDLPAGAAVIDFAVVLHRDFVGRVDHALVTRAERGDAPQRADVCERCDVLHRLRDGDQVELVLRDEYEMLPDGWQERVVLRRQVGQMLAGNLRPQLVDRGMKRLIATLKTRGFGDVEQEVFDNLLEMAIEEVNPHLFARSDARARRRDASWWAQHLGLLDFAEQGHPLPLKPEIDPQKELQLTKAIESLSAKLVAIPEEILDPSVTRGSLRLAYCNTCHPRRDGAVMATVVGTTVVLHDPDAACAQGGTRIQRGRRYSLDQFFVVEADDRDGVVVDLLSLFHRAKVPVVEITARRAAHNWAVIRIETDLLRRSLEEQLRSDIAHIPGVRRVVGPGDPQVQILEDVLPPRRRHDHSVAPTPYICGDVVRDNDHFYGRQLELARLHELIEAQQRGEPGTGGTAFVSGPLKTGKSSLVLRFLRDVERADGSRVVSAFYTAAPRQRWSEVAAGLHERLVKALEAHNQRPQRQQGRIAFDATGGLSALLASVRRARHAPVVVLALDEALRPLRHAHLASGGDPESPEVTEIQAFVAAVHNLPGTLLVWIGPSAPVSHLLGPLQRVLRSAAQIQIGPLDWREAAELLEARWLGWRYRIHVTKQVAQAACRLTGGNPFWLNHLGQAMWQRENHRLVGELHYTRNHLNDAKRHLLSDRTLFVDRIVAEGAAVPAWLPAVMSRLAAAVDEPEGAVRLVDLMATLRSKGHVDDDATIESGLADLAAMGGLWRDSDAVRISAPILAEWTIANLAFLQALPAPRVSP